MPFPHISDAAQFARSATAPLLALPADSNAGKAAGLSKKQASARYPARLARYLIPAAWLLDERKRLGRPLRICEIGTGSGQMKKFVDFLVQNDALGQGKPFYEFWHGFDVAPQRGALEKAGYGKVEDFDADGGSARAFGGYDAVLLLHVLEHLKSPEASMLRLSGALDPGAVVLGGTPSAPHFLVPAREAQLRKKYLPGGHWSKFSAKRTRRMLASSGLAAEEITGAFLLRSSGLFLENHLWWMRLNLLWAHLFPSWPGEVYFRAKKPRP